MKHDNIFRIASHGVVAAKGDTSSMGLKAFDLARMARLGLSVPPALVLGTPFCHRYRQEPEKFSKSLPGLLEDQMHWLQSVTDLGFGDPRKPLLVSVRSGAPVSMPGMMDTLINIGLSDMTVHGMLRSTGNPRLVWDSYRRLVQGFAEVVFGADPRPFAETLDLLLAREHTEHSQELDYLSLAWLTRTYLDLCVKETGKPFPQNPFEQLSLAVQTVIASWDSPRAVEYRRLYGIADTLCTAVTIQQMVFGNAGGTSGAGVGFTRDPDSGEKRLYLDFLFNSQGEDIVSGRISAPDTDRLFLALPEMKAKMLDISAALEQEFGDALEFEFTIQDGMLYLLQARVAKRTPWAALRIAVEQVNEGLVSEAEALARLAGLPLDDIRRQRLSSMGKQPICEGQPAGIGVAVGPLALDIESARRFFSEGRPSVLVREEMATADIAALAISAGVLTSRGSRTSHAAVVARQLGKACITGCRDLRIDGARRIVGCGGLSLAEGELITLDSNSGLVYPGEMELVVDYPTEWLAMIRKWQEASNPGDEAGSKSDMRRTSR